MTEVPASRWEEYHRKAAYRLISWKAGRMIAMKAQIALQHKVSGRIKG
jgi:hypothetical protein